MGASPSVPQAGQALARPSSVEMGSDGQGEKGPVAAKMGDEMITPVFVSHHQDPAFPGAGAEAPGESGLSRPPTRGPHPKSQGVLLPPPGALTVPTLWA